MPLDGIDGRMCQATIPIITLVFRCAASLAEAEVLQGRIEEEMDGACAMLK